jgi:hypothetical protein
MENAKKTAKNEKVQPRLAPLMHRYLDDLVATRLYGNTKTEVAKKLIEDGVRRAIADRHINVRKIAKRRKSEPDDDAAEAQET